MLHKRSRSRFHHMLGFRTGDQYPAVNQEIVSYELLKPSKVRDGPPTDRRSRKDVYWRTGSRSQEPRVEVDELRRFAQYKGKKKGRVPTGRVRDAGE